MKKSILILVAAVLPAILFHSCKPDNPDNHGTMQMVKVEAGGVTLVPGTIIQNVPADGNIIIEFSSALDTASVRTGVTLKNSTGADVAARFTFDAGLSVITMDPINMLDYNASYSLNVGTGIKGINGETFAGITCQFVTMQGKLTLSDITLNGVSFKTTKPLTDVGYDRLTLVAQFSEALDPANFSPFFTFSGGARMSASLSSDNKTVTFSNTAPLNGYSRYYFSISSNLVSGKGYSFDGFSNSFYTQMDSTDKFPRIADEKLIDMVERQTFKYFWDFGHPFCGMARERNTSGDIVTTGGSGFGVMALVAAMDRGYVSRAEGLERLGKIIHFLENCDRFHGAWPHWLNGVTGKTVPFSAKDDGGDLVETAFMIQGLLAAREYLDSNSEAEASMASRITHLWETVEWSWFQNGMEVLFWHWSPNNFFNMNYQIRGYNETLITYVLAASSPTFPVPAADYIKGYAGNGSIRNGKKYFGYTLPLGQDMGGPLFFTHYSHLGLDPRNLSDQFANYWTQNVNQSLINMSYCISNPKGYIGYSADCWGLTASDNQSGYSAHSPTNDLGVITPTAAISSIVYTPEQSMKAIRHFYYKLGDKLWGPYGFYDAFNVTAGWWGNSYIAIDEGPIVVMIENYRSGLLWNLFMKCPEVRAGLTKLGFTW